MNRLMIAALFLILSVPSGAHEPIHKLAVLPLEAPDSLKTQAEEAWWALRQQLAATGRFVVATKRVLLTKDVFVARSTLKPMDALALSQTLNSDAIVTGLVDGSRVVLNLYGRERGALLWSQEMSFSTVEPSAGQVVSLFRQLTEQLLVDIPYQGHLTHRAPVESLRVGQALYFTLGSGDHFSEGDQVIIGDLAEVSREPLFMGGGQVQPIAFGEILSWNPPIAEVRVITLVKGKNLTGPPLVAVPSGMERLKADMGLSDELKVALSSDLSNAAERDRKEKKEETQRLVAVLSWVGSLVAMLVLAF